jgi:formylglycine-generating enzyme required for sulfatase activity
MNLVRIEPGSFLMGSSDKEEGHEDNEVQHRVKLTKPFYMAATTVTQKQWKAVMGTDPSYFKGETLPVEQVSWGDAVSFCRKLSEKEGKNYRLPTEAEWEYACRAGTTTPFNTGATISTGQANYNGNNTYGSGVKGAYRVKTTPVGSFKPNAWGLYDMHGNVWQWCSDIYAAYTGDATDPTGPDSNADHSSRVLRGGSWDDGPRNCRAAYRGGGAPGSRGGYIGFRVCLDF